MSNIWFWIGLIVVALVIVAIGLLGVLGPGGRGDSKFFWYFAGGAIVVVIGIVGLIWKYLSNTPFF